MEYRYSKTSIIDHSFKVLMGLKDTYKEAKKLVHVPPFVKVESSSDLQDLYLHRLAPNMLHALPTSFQMVDSLVYMVFRLCSRSNIPQLENTRPFW